LLPRDTRACKCHVRISNDHAVRPGEPVLGEGVRLGSVRYRFADFELDTESFELQGGGETVHVEPQVFGVLACLVARHERLVSRDELLDEVWGTRFVSAATVASRVKAARRAIGDDGARQCSIRTVTGRGYRFVASVEVLGERREPIASAPTRQAELVGRESELATLEERLRVAHSGSASVVFVTGEAGSGKSSLVDAFRARLGSESRVLVGRSLSLGVTSDPYLPFLDALSGAARADRAVFDALVRFAPTWLGQLPLALEDDAAAALASRALGATQGRMARELIAALETLSERVTTVLVLEDLHWADEPSLHLVETMARAGSAARLLVIGTARPASPRADGRRPSLMLDLTLRDLAVELALDPFSDSEVAIYARQRLSVETVPDWLTALVAERAAGNPLVVRCLLDSWRRERRIVLEDGRVVADRTELTRDVPNDVRRLIGSQLDELGPETRQLVDAASVAGARFCAAEVAAAVGGELAEVDEALGLVAADTRLVDRAGTAAWADGTRSGAYAFGHELFRDGVYEHLVPSRRAEMHDSIGRRLERGYGAAAEGYYAAQLAQHFVAAGDGRAAVRYLRAAAAQSLARSAHAEAALQAGEALELLASLGDDGESAAAEVVLRSMLAAAHIALGGWAAPEIEANYERAREVCELSGDSEHLPPVVYGLATLHEYRGEYDRSEALMSRHLDSGVAALVPEALELLACSTFHQGQFEESLRFAEAGLADVDPSLTSEYLARYGESPVVSYHCWAALALSYLGREADGLVHLHAALRAANEHTYSRTTALAQAAFFHQFQRSASEARRWADATIEVATEHGFPFRVAQATIVHGWATACDGDLEGGADELGRGLELYRATGAGMDLPYFLGLHAEATGRAGRLEEALELVRNARRLLPERGFFYEPSLFLLEARLRSETEPGAALELLERARTLAESQAAASVLREIADAIERGRAGEPIGLP
jgi:DNA-binding winged helix-turn-helix (wHTH) protein